jgi:CPA2 family monovalent cation:H+ antiporter-2
LGALTEVLKLLLLSVFAVAVLRRLRLPPIVGYVLVGAVAGPHAMGWLADTGTIRVLGEVGIAFLLFTLGLEFSIAQFLQLKRVLLIVGGAQVLLGTAGGAVIAWTLGLPLEAALIAGGALAMSSTAIVVKQLRDQLELQTPHGRLALGILLFQDLAAIPFLVVIPILATSGDTSIGVPLALAMGKAVAVAAGMLAFGRYALRPLLREAGESTELFTLTALLVSLAAAWLTHLSGLSLAFGAFVAGMMLSGTEYRHQVENEIRPFRDVLLGLFFIVVGMQLEPALLPATGAWIALLVAGIVLGKGALVALLARAYGYHAPEALRTGLFSAEASQPILAAVIVSMLIAPLLIRRSGAIAAAVFPARGGQASHDDEKRIAAALHGVRGHVLVCGYGRVGTQLTRILTARGVRSVALDTDPGRVKTGWDAGEQVYYGDATRPGVLEAAGLKDARAVVVSFDHTDSAFRVLKAARESRAQVPVLARATDDAAFDALLDAGATEAVPETMETSLMLATQLLLILGQPPRDVAAHMQVLRAGRYRLLRPEPPADPF